MYKIAIRAIEITLTTKRGCLIAAKMVGLDSWVGDFS